MRGEGKDRQGTSGQETSRQDDRTRPRGEARSPGDRTTPPGKGRGPPLDRSSSRGGTRLLSPRPSGTPRSQSGTSLRGAASLLGRSRLPGAMGLRSAVRLWGEHRGLRREWRRRPRRGRPRGRSRTSRRTRGGGGGLRVVVGRVRCGLVRRKRMLSRMLRRGLSRFAGVGAWGPDLPVRVRWGRRARRRGRARLGRSTGKRLGWLRRPARTLPARLGQKVRVGRSDVRAGP
ncbi:hypothetical protein GCM10010171_38340 [Actinokineospora fastidiosa]|uniref:Uncharacterized protein n=1 Tax=Actinokineospora fastidiosa TaxID=1816 RepID=A0A918GJV2_9PSEU|nr:hypothetical protein GCM10010171_38340 [Actinokineospora fastidiosa]